MPTEHTITTVWKDADGKEAVAGRTVSGDGYASYPVTVPANATHFQINVPIDVSHLKVLVIESPHPLTIKTNSSGSPDDTLADIPPAAESPDPYIWDAGNGTDNPFASGTDVTKFYVTCAHDAAFDATIRVLQDATP